LAYYVPNDLDWPIAGLVAVLLEYYFDSNRIQQLTRQSILMQYYLIRFLLFSRVSSPMYTKFVPDIL
jgi:hypothetical protein